MNFMHVIHYYLYETHLYINEYSNTTIHSVQRNITLQCTVMVNDFALTAQWLPVDCNRTFRAMLFICESTIVDIRDKEQLKQLLLYNYICPRHYITLKVSVN